MTLYAAFPGVGSVPPGFYRSTDGAESWTSIANGPTDVEVDPHTPGLFYGIRGIVSRSTDGCFTWRPARNGLPSRVPAALAIDPLKAGVMYASISDDGIYRTLDGGRSWSRFGTPLGNVYLPWGRAARRLRGDVGPLGVLAHAEPVPRVELVFSACARRPPP